MKWPGSVHDARIFLNSKLNTVFREGVMPDCSKIIVEGETPVPICILGDLPSIFFFAVYNERVCQWWKK